MVIYFDKGVVISFKNLYLVITLFIILRILLVIIIDSDSFRERDNNLIQKFLFDCYPSSYIRDFFPGKKYI